MWQIVKNALVLLQYCFECTMCCTFHWRLITTLQPTAIMKKTFSVHGLLASNTRLMDEAVHDAHLSNRAGYDEHFLNKKLPLPSLAASLKKDLPKLQEQVGTHGGHVLDYTHFSVLYNKSKKLPFYTAVNIDDRTNLMRMAHEERPSDVWLPDNRFATGQQKNFQFGDIGVR